MKYTLIILPFILLIGFTGFGQSINESASSVQFTISNFKKEVTGTFKGMKGDVKFDPNNVSNSTINVCIDPATVKTDSEKRDKHLKTDDFFAVEQFPTICFESTEIKASGNGYVATGNLSMHGITKEVEIELNYSHKQLKGTFEVNRLDFEIGPKGKKMIGHSVELQIICELN